MTNATQTARDNDLRHAAIGFGSGFLERYVLSPDAGSADVARHADTVTGLASDAYYRGTTPDGRRVETAANAGGGVDFDNGGTTFLFTVLGTHGRYVFGYVTAYADGLPEYPAGGTFTVRFVGVNYGPPRTTQNYRDYDAFYYGVHTAVGQIAGMIPSMTPAPPHTLYGTVNPAPAGVLAAAYASTIS
jgi:hypothetical protein